MSYVYLYERLGLPLYVGIGSGKEYQRARDIRTGHVDFYMWCKEKFGGVGRVKVRIVVEGLPREQALLIESVLITEHARHHDIFNRVISTSAVKDRYVSRYGKKIRYANEEDRAAAAADSIKRRNENRKNSVKGKEATAVRCAFSKSAGGKKYNRLTANISYNRKIGKPVDDLVAARGKLQTFAQWKKTPEGIRAVRKAQKLVRQES